MPMRLWLKVDMMFPWRKFNCSIWMVQDDTDLCTFLVDVPTITGGTFMLQLP